MAKKSVGWIVCGLAVAGFLVVLAFVTMYSQTEHFRELLRGQLVRALNAKYPGDFELGRISGSIWQNAIISGMTLRYRGAELIQIARIEAAYDLFQLMTGDL
ncbi:MAG: hypothetical protein ACREV4_02565, partial [Gammaproteobacteria bacterium]